ncbi:hypothetical protein QBC44DRAFT_108148 [Cladorrhinum sp. PSN332]|nr:hypothetical protein QBC44DRAFT_108148 [Cladorrhinum sp. PSN332]
MCRVSLLVSLSSISISILPFLFPFHANLCPVLSSVYSVSSVSLPLFPFSLYLIYEPRDSKSRKCARLPKAELKRTPAIHPIPRKTK